ncbi:TIGR01459 family HAD-type hydrolase [Beijerinckiaceae bacterium]|nr:TIGR01459 family HAD-type hydrolase [Beijerinckiaceae bacterium]
MTRLVRGLAELASGYDVVLSDVWGVVHNGLIAFSKAADALSRFRAQGGTVVLITNSPNPSRFVQAQLDRLGVPRAAYDAIVSSGDVTVSLLVERADKGMFRIGPPEETALFDEILSRHGEPPRLVPFEEAAFVLCTGLIDPFHEAPADYDPILARMLGRRLDLICANPDIVVEDGGQLFYCAGAIAERYADMGGHVIQAGKPFAPIFAKALALARQAEGKTADSARILVIGDAMRTDIKGAYEQGLDSLFVTSGIHRSELHGPVQGAALDAAAFRQFVEAADFAPTSAIPELVW